MAQKSAGVHNCCMQMRLCFNDIRGRAGYNGGPFKDICWRRLLKVNKSKSKTLVFDRGWRSQCIISLNCEKTGRFGWVSIFGSKAQLGWKWEN